MGAFRRFMRFPGSGLVTPALVTLAALASAAFLFAHAPAVRAECGTASSAPCPTPVNAFLSLDVTSGDANTVINVTGGQFLPNEQMNLYWDQSGHTSGFAQADANGNFNTRVKPYPGDAPGPHKLCASVQPNPCATFTITAPPTPSPSPSPSASPSPSESPSPVVAGGSSGGSGGSSLSGFDVITHPPFVFLPIAGILLIAVSAGYWLVSRTRGPRPRVLPTAAVTHRATRPDYSAGFGAPAASPTPDPAPQPPAPEAPAPATAPAEPPAAEVDWGPAVEWGTGSADWGFPEPPPDDNPESPSPTD